MGPLIGDVLKLDMANEMLKYVTPEDFRKHIQSIRNQLKALSEEEQLNAVYFPDALVTCFDLRGPHLFDLTSRPQSLEWLSFSNLS